MIKINETVWNSLHLRRETTRKRSNDHVFSSSHYFPNERHEIPVSREKIDRAYVGVVGMAHSTAEALAFAERIREHLAAVSAALLITLRLMDPKWRKVEDGPPGSALG